jgi:hypothetical protein
MMGKTKHFIFLLTFNLFLLPQTRAQSEELIISLDKPGQPGQLEFQNPRGSIRVEGYDGDYVLVEATARNASEQRKLPPDGMKSLQQKQVDLRAESKGNTIQLYCESESTVDFDIKVPRNFSLKLSSLDRGEIFAVRIDGEIEIENRGGGVRLENIRGNCSVSTIYGNISTDIAMLRKDATIMLTSYEGSIEIFISGTESADFMLKSNKGSLFSEHEIKIKDSDVKVTEDGEGREYRILSWTRGTLNGGGGNIIGSSYSGDILIRNRENIIGSRM